MVSVLFCAECWCYASDILRLIATGERVGYNNMIYKESEIDRIARVAADVASKRQGKLCSVDKANVLDVSQLWRDVVTSVIEKDFPDVELSHMYVDNAAMQLIRWPKQFDTIVCGNIFGDILSDEGMEVLDCLFLVLTCTCSQYACGKPRDASFSVFGIVRTRRL